MSRVNDFLDEVCIHVGAKSVHSEIRGELLSHISELTEEGLRLGMSREEAEAKAVSAMGSPEEIGMELNKQHRPKTEWPLILITAAAAILGLVFDLSMGKIVFTALGAVILLGVTFLDYTLLKKCTASVYAVFCGVLILMAVYIRSHGLNTRIFGISAASAQLAQLAPALMAGVLANKKRCRIADLLQIAVMLALPLLACGLCYQFSYSVMLVAAYFIAFTAMLAMGERWAKRLYIAPAAFTVMMSSLIITHPYRLERFTAFLTRGQSDPHGAGYISAVLNGVVKNALPIGGGEVPEIISCERVTYMISWILGKFGYLAAGGVIAVLAVLIARMFMASAKIKNRYGRILGLMCSSVMCVKFAWNVLMNLGLLPVMGITLPIIGVGGTDYVLSMALIGLILSACRRNNMVYETNEVPKSSNAARFWHGVVDKVFGE